MHNNDVLGFYRRISEATGGLGWGATAAIAAGLTVVSTAVGFAFLVMLPADHFTRAPSRTSFWFKHPVMRWVTAVLKNLLGLVMLVLGLIMLVGPGPGLIFTLLGLSLLDMPGKRNLERRIILRPRVLHAINDLRARFGRASIIVDHE